MIRFKGILYVLIIAALSLSRAFMPEDNIPYDTGQLIVISAENPGDNEGVVSLYERNSGGAWQQIDSFNCFIGSGGFSDEEFLEGKEFTPIGLYPIGAAFGNSYNPGTRLSYIEIKADDVWVDDPESEFYNTLQKQGDNKGRWKSAERMNVSAYNLGFVIEYNTDNPIPYAGSAFFFHIFDKPTAGCVGASEEDVRKTLIWLDESLRPLILLKRT